MHAFPHARSPRVLTRLLEAVAAGHRRARTLAELLDVEPPVLRSYLLAAEWLGLLSLGEEPALTHDGLRLLYARARRAQVFGELLVAHATLGPLMPGLDVDALSLLVHRSDPTLAPATVRKRALALRRLCAPGLRGPPRVAVPPPPDAQEDDVPEAARAPEQLTLGFATEAPAPPPPLDLRAGADDNPDVYTAVLRALLDHGELDPHQVRGLLDGVGGRDCGIGGYLAMATRRGDATRVGDVLVVTAGACARRDLAESPVSVALSDPDFRAHLAEVQAGRPGNPRRFRPWMGRLFNAGTLEENLDRLLFGRRLSSFPVAGDPGEPLAVTTDPFLACLPQRGLAIALPSSLEALGSGLAGLNTLLRGARQGATARPPNLIDRRLRVHGALAHPGEAPLRVVPDMVSLRHRALRNVPAFAMLTALGLLDRRGVARVRVYGQELLVAPAGGRPRRVDAVIDALVAHRGWVLARSPTGPSWVRFAEIAEALGLLTTVNPWITIDETLFRKLGSDPEHRDLLEGLDPLAELIAGRLSRR